MSIQKINIDHVVDDLEKFLDDAYKYFPQSSTGLSALKKAIELLNKRSVIHIGEKDLIILADEEIEIDRSKHRSETEEDTDDGDYVSTKTIAEYYGVTQQTIREWIEKNIISGHRVGNRGRYRIPREEFELLKKQRDIGIKETEDVMKEVLGEDYSEDWQFDLDQSEK